MPQLIELYNRKRADYTTKMRAIKDKIEAKDRQMEIYLKSPHMSEMLNRWKEEKSKKTWQSEISNDLKIVERVQPLQKEREKRAAENKDDLVERWNKKNYTPKEKRLIGPSIFNGTERFENEDIQKKYIREVKVFKSTLEQRERLNDFGRNDLVDMAKSKNSKPSTTRLTQGPDKNETQSYPREDIKKDYYNWVENVERIIDGREDRILEKKDDLIRRWREPLTYNPAEKNGIGKLPTGGGKVNSYPREDIQKDIKTVNNLKDTISKRASLAEQRKDDLTRRWANKNWNPVERNKIGGLPENGGPTAPSPREDVQKRYISTVDSLKTFIQGREGLAEQRKDDLTRRWANKNWDPVEKNRIGKLPAGGGPTGRYPRGDVQKDYIKTVNNIEKDYFVWRTNIANGEDDLIKRWKNNEHNPDRRSVIGVAPFAGPVGARTREPRAIEIDISKGTAQYDTIAGSGPFEPVATRHSNKYVEADLELTYQSLKSNYDQAYDEFAYYDKGRSYRALWYTAAQKGFNLGQIMGERYWNTEVNIFQNKSGSYYAPRQLRSELDIHVGVKKDYDLQIRYFTQAANPEKLQVTRLPFKDEAKIPLDILLQQNLLMPREGVFSSNRTDKLEDGTLITFYGFDTGWLDIQKSWQVLYQRNYLDGAIQEANGEGLDSNYNLDQVPSAENLGRGTDPEVYRGWVSRNDVRDLEEPRYIGANTDPSNRRAKVNSGAISFEDDAKYSHYLARDRGFYSNIAGNTYGSPEENNPAEGQYGGGNLMPAVWNKPHAARVTETDGSTRDALIDEQAEEITKEQYFPFMFETANRSLDVYTGERKPDVFEQFAFFQGTISQMSEQFAPNWSSSHFAGRTEETHTYEKGSRTLDLRFIVFANSAREQQNVYERVNWLAQQTYPLYDTFPEKIQAGPILKLTIGDIYKRISGFIRSLSFNWDYLGPNKWQIQRGLQMPMACEISLQFQIIHNRQPDRDTNFYEGLTTGIMGGGAGFAASQQNGIADVAYNIYGGTDEDPGPESIRVNNKYIWSPSTNLIPQKIVIDPNKPYQEPYVNLLARQSFRFDEYDVETAFADGTKRNARVGEVFTYADIVAAAGGASQLEDAAAANNFEDRNL